MLTSILTNFSARFMGAVLNFLMLLLTTHWLGAGIRGEISILQLSINLIHLISDIGGGPAMVYLVPRAIRSKLLLTGGLWAAFASFGVGSILVSYELLPPEFSTEVLIVGFLFSLHSVNQNILLGQERIKEYNILIMMQGVVMFGTMAGSILLAETRTAEAFLHACYVAYGLTWLTGLLMVLRKPHAPTIQETRPLLFVLFANGFFTQLATLTHQLSIRENFFHLKKYYGGETVAVGIYSTAISLGEAILLFSASVAAVLMSKVSNTLATEENRIKTLQLAKLSVGITVPGIVLFLIVPAVFYSWLLGKDFAPVKEVFASVVPGIVLISFGTVFAHYFSGAGKHYVNFIAGIIGLVMALVSAPLLIQSNQTIGAGWSASLAYGSLALFVFGVFIFSGKHPVKDLKTLLPRRDDFTQLKTFLNRKKDHN